VLAATNRDLLADVHGAATAPRPPKAWASVRRRCTGN